MSAGKNVCRPRRARWARRAGGRRIAPGQPADGKLNARPKLRKLDLLRPVDGRQFTALQDEDAVRVLGEDILPGSPGPLFMARYRGQGLRPVRNDVVGS